MGQKKKKLIASTALHGALLAVVAVSVFPILWMCLISVKSTSESLTGFHSLWVSDPTLDNFKRLFQMIPVAQNTFNSVFTTLVGTASSLFFCALAGFAFAKYRFPGRNLLFYSVIATMLVPPEVGAVPLFIIMKKLNLINSLWSLIIPRIATAVGIFYMNQYISDVPDELVEAARIDGCGDFKIFTKVILPVIKPAMLPGPPSP
nr:carbohydrate ABC transporter permease [Enterocloster asparagiformis]